jgi:ring-1,2-phenylacetyl-CoA epoxidase subunit PaaC
LTNRVDKLNDASRNALVQLLLGIADDKLLLGHRNADWTGLAPILEEDIAFSSMAQDELAHASALYEFVAGLLGTKADRLAFGRQAHEYRCAQIVELSDNFNWATALCRSFFCDHYDALRLGRLGRSSYTPLAQLASRLAAEEQVHVEHVDSWMHRLGRGSIEANGRLQEALNRLAPLAPMLLEPTEGQAKLEADGIYPEAERGMFERWAQDLHNVAREAGLTLELKSPAEGVRGGRRGVHSDAFAAALDELTEVYRVEPEAAW